MAARAKEKDLTPAQIKELTGLLEEKRDELVQFGKAFDEALRKGLLQGAGGAKKAVMQGIVAQFKASWKKPLGDLGDKKFRLSSVGESTLKIGFDWTPDGSSLSIGLGHVAKKELNSGMFKVKATAEMGQEVTIPL